MRNQSRTLAMTLSLVLAACTGREANDATTPAATTAPPAPVTAATPAPAATRTAPAGIAAPAMPPAGDATPAPDALTFLGFGPAHWGASEEQVRQAWGKDLEASPGEPGDCRYLFPVPRSEGGYRLAFMIEGGRFVRVDVRAADIVAPGGGRVGMDKSDVHRLYPAVIELPHKYVENGLNLRVADPQGGQGTAVFEVDAAGKVTAWRVGVPPQVDYVEGCS